MMRDDERMREALQGVATLLEAVARLIDAAVAVNEDRSEDDDEDAADTPLVRVEPLPGVAPAAEPSRRHVGDSYCDAPTRKVAVSDELLARLSHEPPATRRLTDLEKPETRKLGSRDGVPRPVPPEGSTPG